MSGHCSVVWCGQNTKVRAANGLYETSAHLKIKKVQRHDDYCNVFPEQEEHHPKQMLGKNLNCDCQYTDLLIKSTLVLTVCVRSAPEKLLPQMLFYPVK